MIVLAGADVVLPDRILPHSSLILDGVRIAAIEPRVVTAMAGATHVDVTGRIIVPGFVDVHVHGLEGIDVLDDAEAVRAVALRLPKYGVTSFCPTSVACDPPTLQRMLTAVASARREQREHAARVLPAHLESNFINPDYKGAQPEACLRRAPRPANESGPRQRRPDHAGHTLFSGQDILDVMAANRASIGIVTVAPELDGGLDLVKALTDAGHIVSIGHTGATYEEARTAIELGVRHATHLFNRMSPMSHRAPGVPGAVLESEQVFAELICDGVHVHPALMRVAIRAKGRDGIVAITDGTAGAGLPIGTVTSLGGRPITVTLRTAVLDDGTLAGSVLTMDGAFRVLVEQLGVPLVDAARLCSTTPARRMGMTDIGTIEAERTADLVVLDRHLKVTGTYVRGQLWRNPVSGHIV
jgi:N-acetylglucosamine-6-phosphate deacetylase